MDEDVYVVVIEPSGYMGSLSMVDKSLAESTARQLRRGGARFDRWIEKHISQGWMRKQRKNEDI